MKRILLFTVCFITLSKSRLIEKITDRTLTIENKTVTSPPVRLARGVLPEDVITGLSTEENEQFNPRFDNTKRNKIPSTNSDFSRHSRISRDSREKVTKPANNVTSTNTSKPQEKPKSKPVLVKKPIPKYNNEMDYDEDFQMKISKSPIKLLDSSEHEDEDFNLDDYDFDVNHDEFASRGKPLEPRMKFKQIQPARKPDPKPTALEIKIKNKVDSQDQEGQRKERSVYTSRKPAMEDNYDDGTARVQKTRDVDEDFHEDNMDDDVKTSKVRMIRSPLNNEGMLTNKDGNYFTPA